MRVGGSDWLDVLGWQGLRRGVFAAANNLLHDCFCVVGRVGLWPSSLSFHVNRLLCLLRAMMPLLRASRRLVMALSAGRYCFICSFFRAATSVVRSVRRPSSVRPVPVPVRRLAWCAVPVPSRSFCFAVVCVSHALVYCGGGPVNGFLPYLTSQDLEGWKPPDLGSAFPTGHGPLQSADVTKSRTAEDGD